MSALEGSALHRLVPGIGLVGCLLLAALLPLTSVIVGVCVMLVGAVAYGLRAWLC